MDRKALYALVIVGALALFLMSIMTAFADDGVRFIDPDDVNPDGSLSDGTPETREWVRQGGRVGLMLSSDSLDEPVKRVLIPGIDARMIGRGDVGAHTAKITDTSSGVTSSLDTGDYVLVGQNTVRKVESVSGGSTVTLDKPFGSGMSNAAIYRINDSVTDLAAWDDNYSSYAMAEAIDGDEASYRETVGVSRFTSRHAIADSDVAESVSGSSVTAQDRLSGSGTGTISAGDVLVLKVSGNTSEAILVANVSGDRIELEDVPGASSGNPLGLGASETAYLVYWAEERNETGSLVAVRSRARPGPVTLVLTETTPVSGQFVLEIATGAPVDSRGNRVTADTDASPPTLPVNPRDVVTLSAGDTTGTLQIETTPPVFSALSPAHNTPVRDNRPEVRARVTDSESGLMADNISVTFRVTEGSTSRTVELVPASDGDVDEIPGGFEISQRLPGAYAPTGDAVIEWWVEAIDNAGNVAHSDSQPSTVHVDDSSPSLLRAETGRHWDASLDTGDSDDKTEYRASRADTTSVLVVFNEHLDDATVTAADFKVDGEGPRAAEVRNVTVRDDSRGGDGNTAIVGDSVRDVGLDRGYVFLAVDEMKPDARPRVELVGGVSDMAGNREGAGRARDADDRTAPTLTVTVTEGDRPVTRDAINLTITSSESTFSPSVSYRMVTSSNSGQTLGPENAASVATRSATEYTATIDAPDDGLYTVFVSTRDSSSGNVGTMGDNNVPVDVDGETSAVLFERDTSLAAPDVDPYLPGVQDEFSTDDANALISIDFSAEASEYYQDTHGTVTILSATLDGVDITDDLQPNQAGNVFLYRPSGLASGEYALSITAMDEAGNTVGTSGGRTYSFDVTVDADDIGSPAHVQPSSRISYDYDSDGRISRFEAANAIEDYFSGDGLITRNQFIHVAIHYLIGLPN